VLNLQWFFFPFSKLLLFFSLLFDATTSSFFLHDRSISNEVFLVYISLFFFRISIPHMFSNSLRPLGVIDFLQRRRAREKHLVLSLLVTVTLADGLPGVALFRHIADERKQEKGREVAGVGAWRTHFRNFSKKNFSWKTHTWVRWQTTSESRTKESHRRRCAIDSQQVI